MKRLSALLILALAGPLFGQTLTLPATVSGDPGAFISIPATTDCTSVKWLAIDKGLNLFPVDRLKDTKTAIVTGGTPGSYRLMAVGAKADVPTDPQICVVVINGPPAPPVPVNPPGPVAPTSLFLVPIFDGTKDPVTAPYLTNAAYWTSLGAKGIKYGLIDTSNAAHATDAAKFTTWTAKTGLPALIVMDQAGAVIDAIALPASSTGVDAEVAKFTKGK